MLILAPLLVFGQFGNIFEHMFRHQQQEDPRARVHKDSNLVEHQYDNGKWKSGEVDLG